MKKRWVIGSVIPFLLGLLLAATAATALSEVGDHEVQPATQGQKTYHFDHFEIEYPYGVSVDGGTTAAVGYVASWATGAYPGVAECQLTLSDSSGAVVGDARFTVDSGSPVFHRPVGREVVVKGKPTSAEAICSEGNHETSAAAGSWDASDLSPAYDKSDPSGPKRYEDRLMIEFDVDWSGRPAFQRTCRMTIGYRDGTEKTLDPFNTNMGSGPQEYNVLVGDPDTVERASLSCGQLEI